MREAKRPSRRRRPSRLQLVWWRRSARKREAYIQDYEFPVHIGRRLQRRYPALDERGQNLIEQGLREWFICCAWRGRAVLGMPSRAVDDAWHEFILDSIAYTAFCNAAFGAYLHHTPDEAMSTPMAGALSETVRAWDRSDSGAYGESVLWDLDEQLEIPEPLGIDGLQLSASRSGGAGAGTPWIGGCAGGVGDGGSGGEGGGEGSGCAGGGCGGGGCGGGGCGGGS